MTIDQELEGVWQPPDDSRMDPLSWLNGGGWREGWISLSHDHIRIQFKMILLLKKENDAPVHEIYNIKTNVNRTNSHPA